MAARSRQASDNKVCVALCRVVLCLGIGELVRRWAFTGTLDPVRGLTGLTTLDVATNSIGGMSVRRAVAVGGCRVGALHRVRWDMTVIANM
jgi:hypothetical protein